MQAPALSSEPSIPSLSQAIASIPRGAVQSDHQTGEVLEVGATPAFAILDLDGELTSGHKRNIHVPLSILASKLGMAATHLGRVALDIVANENWHPTIRFSLLDNCIQRDPCGCDYFGGMLGRGDRLSFTHRGHQRLNRVIAVPLKNFARAIDAAPKDYGGSGRDVRQCVADNVGDGQGNKLSGCRRMREPTSFHAGQVLPNAVDFIDASAALKKESRHILLLLHCHSGDRRAKQRGASTRYQEDDSVIARRGHGKVEHAIGRFKRSLIRNRVSGFDDLDITGCQCGAMTVASHDQSRRFPQQMSVSHRRHLGRSFAGAKHDVATFRCAMRQSGRHDYARLTAADSYVEELLQIAAPVGAGNYCTNHDWASRKRVLMATIATKMLTSAIEYGERATDAIVAPWSA